MGASACHDCPISKWNLDGWFCMSHFERALFVAGWMLTTFSAVLTTYKTSRFIKRRVRKMKNFNVKVTLKNFIFLGKILNHIRINVNHIF